MKAAMPQVHDSVVETGRVLVVDDHAQARESIAHVLRHAGHDVQCFASAIDALKAIERESFDVILTDLQMPGMTGLEFIHRLHRVDHGAQIVMITAHATVTSAVDAIRHGAFDYIEKPFDIDQLEQLVRRAMQYGQILDCKALPAAIGATLIGTSPAMQSLRRRIAQVACTPETVLITGESGTGKELVAQAVHAASSRRDKPLVSLNCPVLSAQLMESELFGHERGAFTGAETRRTGRFELADGSSILLDEISEIDMLLQAKLLRVLQERSFERVGSSETRTIDVRVLATTNRDLRKEVAAGRFREDLYYRLAVVPLELPSLRERLEDVPELTDHFLARSAARLGREPAKLLPETLELLCSYHWPGNVRELENIITRATVLSTDGVIEADTLRPWLQNQTSPASASMINAVNSDVPPAGPGESLEAMERRLIETTLERFGGHRGKTAEALGIGLRTLSGKLKTYGHAPRNKLTLKVG